MTMTQIYADQSLQDNTVAPRVVPKVLVQPTNFLKNLIYGGSAGAIGALCTFPIDTAKTRFQAEKVAAGQQRQYKSIVDALVKIGRAHGVSGLYRGLPVQLIGIIPEKALKLSVNDSARYFLRDRKTGSITLFNEALAGGIAGFCQVIVTSPMEMLKIRLQMQATLPVAQQRSAAALISDVFRGGITSIYRGAGATLLRDVFFSVLYFPLFSNLKLYLASQSDTSIYRYLLRPNTDSSSSTGGLVNVNARVNLMGTFLCGLVAGSACGWAATPADVIKTRLQAPGGTDRWINIRNCVQMTLKEEGVGAFFKGATARLALIGPLFGIVLATYEFMPRFIPL